MAAGIDPHPTLVPSLVERCAVEPDFYVRDTLTWALTRQSASAVIEMLRDELTSDRAQGRSQALHTLSKIGDRRTWPLVTPALLCDCDDEVARSAWRAAVVLVPVDERQWLAAELATQLGRGSREVHRSLARALVALGDDARESLLAASDQAESAVRAHACATLALLEDPDAGFDSLLEEAMRRC
jgi:HEAT repeat protein